ncbi:MAG: type II toxin-antitoxin system VapC family toxin [Candidatus Omnitrophica bacterium]|nr:type II toxin-antitoxin system VapC family toxin [Candidatus Omnitrophota bacterium]
MNIVDTSAWLEYFTDHANAKHFAQAIEDTAHLVVPVICLYEVFKKILQESGEHNALEAVGLMNQGLVIPLDAPLALSAAQISAELKLPMADSIVLATARSVNGTVWTQDADFKGLPGVRFFPKH